jgi:DNA-binding winged helix-turn-helix (wHTH) protein
MRGELREDFRVEGRLVQTRLNRVVSAGGQVVQVQPKIMDVLVRLAKRPGEVVTREELLGTVWAGTHVTEHVLARAISELRKVFDDSAQKPRVIETIPKVGYRLIAPVTAAGREEKPNSETAAAVAHTASAPPPPGRRPTRLEALRNWAGLAALSTATALVLVVIYLLLSTRHVGPWHFNH